MSDNIKIAIKNSQLTEVCKDKVASIIRLAAPECNYNFISPEQQADTDIQISYYDELNTEFDKLPKNFTCIERGDARDILLIKPTSLEKQNQQLKILLSSNLPIKNLNAFLSWSLPFDKALAIQGTQLGHKEALRYFFNSDFNGLVLPKYILDALLSTSKEELKKDIQQCSLQVIPLSVNPGTAGKGALIAYSFSKSPKIQELLANLNKATELECLKNELLLNAKFPSLAVKVLKRPYGIVTISNDFADPDKLSAVQLSGQKCLPKKAATLDKIFFNIHSDCQQTSALANAFEIAQPDLKSCGLWISKACALPENWSIPTSTIVWTAGIKSWQKLSNRGVWVSGCSESLGEQELPNIEFLKPETNSWVKLTHSTGYLSSDKKIIATYQINKRQKLTNLTNKTHYFWHSASDFQQALELCPNIIDAWHACGPGNSYKIISSILKNKEKLCVFLSETDFIAAVSPVVKELMEELPV